MQDWGGTIFWIFLVSLGLFFLFRIVRYGGFKGAMFGANIERTLGEVQGQSVAGSWTTVKVHVLSSESKARTVGIEVIGKSIASYQVTPIKLSSIEAQRLASLLQSAAIP
jgi:ribosomal protein S28E/S33